MVLQGGRDIAQAHDYGQLQAMTFYLGLYVALMVIAMFRHEPVSNVRNRTLWPWQWFSLLILLTVIIGFRYRVGADWQNYLDHVDEMARMPIDFVLTQNDPAYFLLNWVGANVFGGIYFVNLVCAFLFVWGLLVFCRSQPLPWLSVVVAVPYLIVVVAMGYTRQAVAIGLSMAALVYLLRGDVGKFVVAVGLAGLFHTSAIALLPLAFFVRGSFSIVSLFGVAIISTFMFFLLLQNAVSALVEEYLKAQYHSSGAAIRVAMNCLPAAIFLLLRSQFNLDAKQRIFWTIMAIGGVAFVPLLYLSPSTTAVDRLALYWIPLQIFVLGRMPLLSGLTKLGRAVMFSSVAIYSLFVLVVWLSFADHSFAWKPYRFYPLEVI